MFVVVRRDAADVAVLGLRGPLVFGPATATLRAAVDEVLRDTPLPVICDLTEVNEADSSGLAALVNAQEEVRRGGRHLVLLRPGSRLRAMIDTARLSPLVDIADDLGEAVRRAVQWRSDAAPRRA